MRTGSGPRGSPHTPGDRSAPDVPARRTSVASRLQRDPGPERTDRLETPAWTDEVARAADRIAPYLRPTPLVRSEFLSRELGREVLLKLETQQPVGAFKVRPALNSILADLGRCRERGVVTNSSGNFAQAVAYAATLVGVDATIVMMRGASAFKRDRTRSFGGRVAVCDDTFEARAETTERIRAESGRALVHPYDSPESIAGNGTLGLELLDQIEGDFTLFAPVSGGGLIAGTALAVKEARPRCRIYGVQARANPAMKLSLDRGSRVRTVPAPSLADALTVPRPGANTFRVARRLVEDVYLVSETAMRSAIRDLAVGQKLVAEAGGAASVAAARATARQAGSSPVVCVISGGNIEPLQLSRILAEDA